MTIDIVMRNVLEPFNTSSRAQICRLEEVVKDFVQILSGFFGRLSRGIKPTIWTMLVVFSYSYYS